MKGDAHPTGVSAFGMDGLRSTRQGRRLEGKERRRFGVGRTVQARSRDRAQGVNALGRPLQGMHHETTLSSYADAKKRKLSCFDPHVVQVKGEESGHKNDFVRLAVTMVPTCCTVFSFLQSKQLGKRFHIISGRRWLQF
eukprot:scaffold102_cov340-Pavlova_lutheri.AAC.69